MGKTRISIPPSVPIFPQPLKAADIAAALEGETPKKVATSNDDKTPQGKAEAGTPGSSGSGGGEGKPAGEDDKKKVEDVCVARLKVVQTVNDFVAGERRKMTKALESIADVLDKGINEGTTDAYKLAKERYEIALMLDGRAPRMHEGKVDYKTILGEECDMEQLRKTAEQKFLQDQKATAEAGGTQADSGLQIQNGSSTLFIKSARSTPRWPRPPASPSPPWKLASARTMRKLFVLDRTALRTIFGFAAPSKYLQE